MKKIDDGGYAYPVAVPVEFQFMESGITRRDLGAIEIAAGIWSNSSQLDFLMEALKDDVKVCQAVARMAYTQVDALIDEGKKGGE